MAILECAKLKAKAMCKNDCRTIHRSVTKCALFGDEALYYISLCNDTRPLTLNVVIGSQNASWASVTHFVVCFYCYTFLLPYCTIILLFYGSIILLS